MSMKHEILALLNTKQSFQDINKDLEKSRTGLKEL